MGSLQSTAVRMGGGGGVLSVDGQTAVSQRKVGTNTNDGLDCCKDSTVGV